MSVFEAETTEQAKLEKKGEFVTIGEIEETNIPELREPEVPSTEIIRYRKGRVRQLVEPSKLRLSGRRNRSAQKGRLTPTSSDFPGISA